MIKTVQEAALEKHHKLVCPECQFEMTNEDSLIPEFEFREDGGGHWEEEVYRCPICGYITEYIEDFYE